jgi:hypothetical protein
LRVSSIIHYQLTEMNASKQSFIASALLCVVLAALFVARYRLAPLPIEAPFEGGMPLAAMLVRVTALHPWLAAVVAAVLVGWTLTVVVQLTIKYAPAASRNYLPPQILLICVGGMIVSDEAPAAIVVVWLSALAARQLVHSFHKGYSFPELFHAGFYMGLIPLLYAPAAAIVPVIAIAALVIYRRSGREAVVCLAGLLLPLSGAGFIYWATGAGADFIYRELWRCALDGREVWSRLPVSLLVVAVPLLAIVMVGIFWALTHKTDIRKAQYKFLQLTSVALLSAAASGFIPGTSTTFFALAAVPCTLTIPYAFPMKLTSVSTALYCTILAAVFILGSLFFWGIFIH